MPREGLKRGCRPENRTPLAWLMRPSRRPRLPCGAGEGNRTPHIFLGRKALATNQTPAFLRRSTASDFTLGGGNKVEPAVGIEPTSPPYESGASPSRLYGHDADDHVDTFSIDDSSHKLGHILLSPPKLVFWKRVFQP